MNQRSRRVDGAPIVSSLFRSLWGARTRPPCASTRSTRASPCRGSATSGALAAPELYTHHRPLSNLPPPPRYEGAPKGINRVLRLPSCADCHWRLYEKDGKQGVWRIDASIEDVQTGKTEKYTWAIPQCMLHRTDENDGPGQAEIELDVHKYIRDRLGMSSARYFTKDKGINTGLPMADFGYKQMLDENGFAPGMFGYKKPGQKKYGYGKREIYEEEPPKPKHHGWRE